MSSPDRLIIGITGASGVVYAHRMLEVLRDTPVETHLVVSKAAEMTISYELEMKAAEIKAQADKTYAIADVGAAISSGSFKTLGMVIVPCSVRTMSEIASGVTSSLLTRAADVVLKEKRRLTLMVRETPFHLGHLRTMTALAEMGAIIAPPLPAFYAEPKTISELIDQSVGRVLDLYDIETPLTKRWGEDLEKGRR
ncbi:UbiX family flavin prenyltransferase [Parvularcula flava]|uniref:Flavin prenyltransferase UbiX n=1 Tax=Aquisalinus luteolus TaxID=1566827 RepID=A0A8J3A0K0_9PROT|nr:UbiX family flavin prenyltransferase [Aquisalinus luteolus]NHK26735.1 UbiX family flavin prenyltransferase [Aquisalinus luteolus]GGH93258.1 flavin prenyltransferase UbiX [Aquisalinus luteolus]